jgi:hypothetical protein
MNRTNVIYNIENLKELLKAFIDDPSDKTAYDLSPTRSDFCWLASMRFNCRCIPGCPAKESMEMKGSHFHAPLCTPDRFYKTWKTKPAKALLFAMQFLSFLESHENSDGQSKGNT